MQTASALALSLLAAACSSASAPHDSYSFGRIGGNIRPYTITITSKGTVTTQGAVTLEHPGDKISNDELAKLDRLVRTTRFFSQPTQTRCPGTLPDIAATFIKITTPTRQRRVLVHGTCNTRYQKLYDALTTAAGIQ